MHWFGIHGRLCLRRRLLGKVLDSLEWQIWLQFWRRWCILLRRLPCQRGHTLRLHFGLRCCRRHWLILSWASLNLHPLVARQFSWSRTFPCSTSWRMPMVKCLYWLRMNRFRKDLATTARQWQVWRLFTKVVAKFMSYDLQTSRLQKPENSRIV